MADRPQVRTDEESTRALVRDVVVIALMLGAITALHMFTRMDGPTGLLLHDVYKRMYYVPILYAAFVLGLRGGLSTAIASALLYLPFYRLGGDQVLGTGLDNLIEIVMYVVMGVMFGFIRDIEERRTRDLVQVSSKLEDAYRVLEDRAMQLISIQEYTQSILRSVTSGVLTVGPDASVATVNPSAERMLGVSEEQAVAHAIGTIFREDGGLANDIRKVLSGRIPRTTREMTLTTVSGKMLHAQASVSRMRDVGGRKLGAVVTIEDVSDIKSLTEQLIRADRLAAMGELTAGVAHEVRNPLGIIRASVQLMDTGASAERRHEAAEVIKHEIDRLDRVIKALLDFGRPAQPSMRPVRIRTVLEEVVLFSRTFASRGRVDIVEDYGEGIPDVFADPEQLKQVFVNLISNAVQAMSSTGGTLTVSTGTEQGFVCIRFADDGPGIPADIMGKIFDPFVSTRDEGTGLGLTIVHRIVDDHDGHIEVASEPGEGTVFTVWLPALQ